MKRRIPTLLLFLFFTTLATLAAQYGQATLLADGSVLDTAASVLSVVGRVEYESGVRRGLVVAGLPLTPTSRIRLHPESSMLLRRSNGAPIRVLGQGSWQIADLLDLARAQEESQLVVPALEALVRLPVVHREELLSLLERELGGSAPVGTRGEGAASSVQALAVMTPEEAAESPDALLMLYRHLQLDHDATLRALIGWLGTVRADADSEAIATLARAHLLIDHFAYAEALESLGRYLRGAPASEEARQHALLLQAVGFLGLGNRGSARHFLRVAQDINPESDIARTAGYFLEQLP